MPNQMDNELHGGFVEAVSVDCCSKKHSPSLYRLCHYHASNADVLDECLSDPSGQHSLPLLRYGPRNDDVTASQTVKA